VAPARGRNVCTIAAGAPFLRTLADALLQGRVVAGFPASDDPAALADATIYVPTRRAARALAEELGAAAGAGALILPRIVPLGAMEGIENELLFAAPSLDDAFREDAPEAISELDRRLALMRLILAWAKALRGAISSVDAQGRALVRDDEPLLVTSAPAQAFHLAGDLAALIDEMIVEDVDWAKLDQLAPERLDEYWRITLNFLAVAREHWPAHLAEIGRVDRARRQAELVSRRVAQIEAGATGVEIVAGSTGTNAATARLIAAIAQSPRGAVVLPGLDLGMDAAAWRAVASSEAEADSAQGHPQAALRRLLTVIGVERADVRELAAVDPARGARMAFVSEALRPAETTDAWPAYRARVGPQGLAHALADVAMVEAADEREEALAIAVALREALETPGRTAALVTPDRNLARRVRAELARWRIEIDDSGGDPLVNAPHGVLARLALASVDAGAGASAVLALLRHPLARLGLAPAERARRIDAAEIGLLRGLRPDLSDPQAAIARARKTISEDWRAHDAAKRISEAGWAGVSDLFARLSTALAPLRALEGAQPLPAWAQAHRLAVEALAAPAPDAAPRQSDDAECFDALMKDLIEAGDGCDIQFTREDYAAFFEAAARDVTVRGPRAHHPRIKSLGLLEARLIEADLIVLGGLDETVWPPAARTDAFLNRPMRMQLGLAAPERRIGQTAHDFMQALGAGRVVLTRALKRNGAPTTPSRFLLRMQALAGDEWADARARGAIYLDYARRLDAPVPCPQSPRPAPCPPLDLRPTQLSVTRIERLRRDPYAIYAERILRLAPLDGLDVEEGAREAGVRMHDMLGRFQKAFPQGALPGDALARLMDIAREVYAQDLDDPEFRAFGWPRVEAICAGFVAWDEGRRGGLAQVIAEERGELFIPLADGTTFRLTAEADRIERRIDGAFVVIDFKTGVVPSVKMVSCGLAPQLTLEAQMIAQGAFPGTTQGASVANALYVKLGGLAGVASEREATREGRETKSLSDAMEDHYAGLVSLLNEFRDPRTPYVPRLYPQFESHGTPYDHLSRHREWSAGGTEEGA
jgi:ATP-dependent helicase/nuclease subunit B